MSKTVYITEEQEQALVDKYLTEALIVNSEQVSGIVNYLNKFYQAGIDYAGDIGNNGLQCPTLGIVYAPKGQPLQKLDRKNLLDVINNEFRSYVKDDASRLAYFDKIITDWLNKKVKKTGQLTVNYIDDKTIDRYRNHKSNKDNSKSDKKDEKKDSDKRK